ncbi:hypothetical protein JXM83_01095 [Candidatus Woesearchaeota archaeon]|nr:hypothetical protein [Candidatus Woesearchaeota archaeon]
MNKKMNKIFETVKKSVFFNVFKQNYKVYVVPMAYDILFLLSTIFLIVFHNLIINVFFSDAVSAFPKNDITYYMFNSATALTRMQVISISFTLVLFMLGLSIYFAFLIFNYFKWAFLTRYTKSVKHFFKYVWTEFRLDLLMFVGLYVVSIFIIGLKIIGGSFGDLFGLLASFLLFAFVLSGMTFVRILFFKNENKLFSRFFTSFRFRFILDFIFVFAIYFVLLMLFYLIFGSFFNTFLPMFLIFIGFVWIRTYYFVLVTRELDIKFDFNGKVKVSKTKEKVVVEKSKTKVKSVRKK